MPISAALGSSALLPAGLGFRNVIINGSMSVSQRYGTTGISFGAGGGNLYYGTDRFSTEDYTWSAGSNPTVKQSTSTTEGFAFPSGFDYAYKINTGATGLTLASGGVIRIRHVVEGFNALPLYGKPCYLSFWVRSSKTGIYTINMNNGNWGAGQATRMIAQEFTIDVANTWEYKTIPVNMGSATASGTWNKTNSYGLGIEWVLGANANRTGDTYKNDWQTFSSYHIRTASSVNWAADANATFYLTGVQLEQNTQPTSFEQRPYGIELELCKRYYQQERWALETGPLISNLGFAWANTAYKWINVTFPTEMRTAPTVTTESGAGAGFDGKVRYITSTVSGSGVDLTPYSVNTKSTSITLKSYNEANAYTHYGLNAGYRAEADM